MLTSTPASVIPKILFLATLILLAGGCQQSEKKTLVVFIGGLGMNQLGDVQSAVQKQCPGVDVISAGAWDGYKSDLKSIASANPAKEIVLVGHSFGCDAIAESAPRFQRVDLAVFIEPVWHDIRLPKNIGNYVWFQRSDDDFCRESRIIGGGPSKVIAGDHNSITHSPQLIAGVVDAINKMKTKKTLTTADRNKQPVWFGL